MHESDREELPESEDLFQRQWISQSKWYPNPSCEYISLSFTEDDSRNTCKSENIRVDEYDFNTSLPESSRRGEPINIYVSSDLGEISFEGELGSGGYGHDVTASGIIVAELNHENIEKIKGAFGQRPSLDVAISLIIKDVGAEQIIEYADCGAKLNISQAGELAANDFKVGTIKALIEAGYKFDGEAFISLARHNISGDYAIGWKKAGFNLSADQLVYAKQRNLSSERAVEWQKAGHELSLEQLYWVKQRNIHPQESMKWKEAGLELSLEQLQWVKQRNIYPAEFAAWKEAGREFTLDQLQWAKQRNIYPSEFVAWKEAKRELTLEQLQWVKQRNIHPAEFVAWKEAGREFSLEQLQWAKQRNISPEEFTSWQNSGYELSLEKLFWVKQRNLNPQEAAHWKKLGYDSSVEDLYRLRQYNISPSYGEAFVDPEYERLSIDELIEFKRSNISPETVRKLRQRAE
ncbi:MAG: hypothetical protein JW715_01785 [Sedimentisphaerales bacterium]|nr:hypothetical protein [Sedimentisphaerales bacterium]